MACNENVIKNMASEVSRNCQAKNINVEVEFVIYLIEFLLLNPKYGKLFAKTLNRNNLEYFVNECVAMLSRGETSINTLKMQFIIQSNYDKPQILIEKHNDSIETCLRPLVNEILDTDPESEDINEFTKLYRKISIYIVLASGLGNPGVILTLKEGMAALESVFSLDDVYLFVALPRPEKAARLKELLEIVSGVRLFNRDCKLAGEDIPDLPFNLVDAGKGCLASLSHALISVMQRVNLLTTAIADCITNQDETGNVVIDIPPNFDLTTENYKKIFDLLSFNRQYELYIRKLLADVETLVQSSMQHVDQFESVLSDLHEAVKYKEAVPVDTVFPLFTKLWQVWRSMQNIMYLVSTVNLLTQTLASIQEHTKIPQDVVHRMVKGKSVMTDQERMQGRVSVAQRVSLVSMANYMAYGGSSTETLESWEKHVQFLGFCAMCLVVGALVPSNMRIGLIKARGLRFGFCSVKMASRFSKNPERYLNEVLNYARNNPHIINLLNIKEQVEAVKDVDCLVETFVPKIKISDKAVQTAVHPIEEYKEFNYNFDLWEWKRRACQWANIVNCKTHSTQTQYSHLRSEIHCQTVEPRDKGLQTKRDQGMNTNTCNFFLWGLRGATGEDRQHAIDFVQPHTRDKRKAHPVTTCKWPCIEKGEASETSSEYDEDTLADVLSNMRVASSVGGFYDPTKKKEGGLFRDTSRMISKKTE